MLTLVYRMCNYSKNNNFVKENDNKMNYTFTFLTIIRNIPYDTEKFAFSDFTSFKFKTMKLLNDQHQVAISLSEDISS